MQGQMVYPLQSIGGSQLGSIITTCGDYLQAGMGLAWLGYTHLAPCLDYICHKNVFAIIITNSSSIVQTTVEYRVEYINCLWFNLHLKKHGCLTYGKKPGSQVERIFCMCHSVLIQF